MKSQPLTDPSRRIGAPKNWDHAKDGLCHTLEVWDRDGWMISAWRPSSAELERLNSGQCILLWISGSIHPVVSLEVNREGPVALDQGSLDEISLCAAKEIERIISEPNIGGGAQRLAKIQVEVGRAITIFQAGK